MEEADRELLICMATNIKHIHAHALTLSHCAISTCMSLKNFVRDHCKAAVFLLLLQKHYMRIQHTHLIE